MAERRLTVEVGAGFDALWLVHPASRAPVREQGHHGQTLTVRNALMFPLTRR